MKVKRDQRVKKRNSEVVTIVRLNYSICARFSRILKSVGKRNFLSKLTNWEDTNEYKHPSLTRSYKIFVLSSLYVKKLFLSLSSETSTRALFHSHSTNWTIDLSSMTQNNFLNSAINSFEIERVSTSVSSRIHFRTSKCQVPTSSIAKFTNIGRVAGLWTLYRSEQQVIRLRRRWKIGRKRDCRKHCRLVALSRSGPLRSGQRKKGSRTAAWKDTFSVARRRFVERRSCDISLTRDCVKTLEKATVSFFIWKFSFFSQIFFATVFESLLWECRRFLKMSFETMRFLLEE